MALNNWRTVAARQADAKIKVFTIEINELVYAGFADQCDPAFSITDNDGRAWPKAPSQMNPADIFEYIEHRFGPLFLGFIKDRSDFTVQ
jgi:hypothetical protein